ncbi:MAG: hypothetical protein ACT4OM_13045 [Actinomycetota bacterium]
MHLRLGGDQPRNACSVLDEFQLGAPDVENVPAARSEVRVILVMVNELLN